MNNSDSPEQEAVAHFGRGNYISTYTGKHFFIEDIWPEDVCIEDIAHSLAYQCRFTGHCPTFYSVAEHSYHISNLVLEKNALWGLLHDASEAYLADIARPIKEILPGYKELEENVLEQIGKVFGLSYPMPTDVKYFDKHIVRMEAEMLWPITPEWTKAFKHIDNWRGYSSNLPWSPIYAERMFLTRFGELTRG